MEENQKLEEKNDHEEEIEEVESSSSDNSHGERSYRSIKERCHLMAEGYNFLNEVEDGNAISSATNFLYGAMHNRLVFEFLLP